MKKLQYDQEYSEQEIARRRDAVIRRMIATPPKPHSEMKMGKQHPAAKKKKTEAKKTRPKNEKRIP
jgi:hypothetical protein